MRTIIIAAVVVLCTACTPDQLDWWQTADRHDRDAVTIDIIHAAAAEFGVDGDRMVRLARCESTLNTWAINGRSRASGLFQYLPSTWERARWRLVERGLAEHPYEPWDVFNPIAAARITANVISEGGASWWECRY